MARGPASSPTENAFDQAARPVLDWIGMFDRHARHDVRVIVDEAARELKTFERALTGAGIPAHAIKPARLALAVLMDGQARSTRGLPLGGWSVLATRQLFEGHDMTMARIRDFQKTALKNGAEYADLAAFLGRMIDRAEVRRHGHRALASGGWGWKVTVFVTLLALGLAGYAVFLEYRFHAALRTAFDVEALEIGLDRPQEGSELVRRLDAMKAAADRVSDAAARAPLKRALRLPVLDSETHATGTYLAAVNAQVPAAIAGAIETVLATEGDGLNLYDALRAWAVLSGDDIWHPAWIAGWLTDHGAALGLDGLARHVAALQGPTDNLVPQDQVVMDQARAFAAEPTEPARAWLELKRAPETAALASWYPDVAVPGMAVVFVRRSGVEVTAPLPGLFTAKGWDHARNFGIGGAVQKARAMAPVITGQTLPTENRSPDLLADRLLNETVAVWQAWLADLRVRPFAQRETAILVSGALAQNNDPISRLLREVWVQVGGEDRTRSHAQQLRLATVFGPTIQYLDQGRMAEIARLFSTLNVALGAIDVNRKRGTERLMSVQDRARSIAALGAAPRIVVQIAEDVLAQSSQPEADSSDDPLTRVWQREVFPLCRDGVMGRYPFGPGADAALADVTALFGPQGAITTFLQSAARPFLETGESPWRWKPEARFAGLNLESAVFLERAAAISRGLFNEAGEMRQDFTLSALAERGQTLFAIGGEAAPVRARGETATLSWPGPAPQAGVEVSFRESADAARIQQPGPWGLLRLVDGVRLRLRDDGARVLLDLRTTSGRVFLNMSFTEPVNLISARRLLNDFSCPPAL
ncbi:hypothetical protein GCM10007928_30570 [Sulfitobacter porphyrae]|nr:hypothetical protein GCM10007928_30570 [Sulfitobacter porphyrae]